MIPCQYKVQPGGNLQGTVQLPGDKSISHRAVILGAIAEGISYIKGFCTGLDCLATVQAFRDMGVQIETPAPNDLEIHGVGKQGLKSANKPIDLGNSGTSLRLLTGLLSGQGFASELTGDESLMKRPMDRIIKPLQEMGANVSAVSNSIQINSTNNLQGISYQMPVVSAQVKSCLLLAALYAQGETTVLETIPTRDHTERMLKTFGSSIHFEGSKAQIFGEGQLYATELEIPADISSGAFFIVGATIAKGSEILLKNVGFNPLRTGLVNILRLMGANITILNDRMYELEPVVDIKVSSSELQGIEVPLDQVSLMIDEFPILFIAAAFAQGVTVVRGIKELRVKESDRIAAMAEGLEALGVVVHTAEDSLTIEGRGSLRGGQIHSHGDHRVSMAFAMAALISEEEIIIKDCKNVETSFPNFLETANRAGLEIIVEGINQ